MPRHRSSPVLAFVVTALAAFALAAPAHADPAEAPASFMAEIQALRRVVACDERVSDAALPEGITAKWVAGACKDVKRRVGQFKKRWLDKAQPFLAGVVPADVPKTVVYPFGGADLMTALTVYPNASSITTMSLEWVGDPRGITRMDAAQLRGNVKTHHAFLVKLFQVNHNRTVDLQDLNQSPIPAPLTFALKALDLLGYEPTDARWFRFGPSGAIEYLTPSMIAELDASPAGKKQKARNEFFANVELRFKKSGVAGAPEQVWRHVRANLHDDELKGSPVLAHLESLGAIAGITKAASYLIWREDFSIIRDYMLAHMTWMISDSSGIAPYHAAAKGFVQDTWGVFAGNMFPGAKKAELAFIDLWRTNPQRALPMQFGYPDKNDANHMLVTRKP